MDCFYCGGRLFSVDEIYSCCSSCGKIEVYCEYERSTQENQQPRETLGKLGEANKDVTGKE